ncbi:MAG: hypothetical protein ACKO2P_03135 [Planctomycetota bacterium]
MTVAQVLVAGLGSSHGDDQAGWITVDHLQTLLSSRTALQPHVAARRLSTPFDLLTLFPDYQHILIVDAVQATASERSQVALRTPLPAPWTAQTLAEHFTHSRRPRLDTHGPGLSEVLQLATLQSQASRPQVTVFGIPASDFAAFTVPSPAVLERARTTALQILSELKILCQVQF